jgi:hypothetical protein
MRGRGGPGGMRGGPPGMRGRGGPPSRGRGGHFPSGYAQKYYFTLSYLIQINLMLIFNFLLYNSYEYLNKLI